jgi:hypothetical protein
MAQYAAFAAGVARRYGPGGTFWHVNPGIRALPIRSWQIWNEPNFKIYWGWHPDIARYVAMLRAAYRSIRAVDRHAEVVTAGPANTNPQNGIPLPTFLHGLLAARPPFSTLAIDVYTAAPAGLLLTVEQVRAALAAVGRSATPIWLTEFGWASGGPASGFTVGASLQARYVFYTIVTLAEDASTLGIRGIVYFDWQDGSPYLGRSNFWGLHTGLVALNGQKKPALSKYYQAAGVVTGLP